VAALGRSSRRRVANAPVLEEIQDLDRTTAKAARLAVQHQCWVGPNEPRPVAMDTGTMRIGNGGENDGYVTPDYYLYSQFLTNGLRR
jgi:hypothetical protein